MSKPDSAARDSWSKPVVTPPEPPQYDDPEKPDSEWQHSTPSQDRDDQPQRVQEDRPVSSKPSKEAPPSSPSRAESPTSRQWSKSASTFSLKRASTTPVSLEKVSRPTISQSPQLSERDSIFATHYLPPDSESSTPKIKPVQGDVRGPSNLTPTRNGHSPSPSLRSPFRSYLDADALDDDMTRSQKLSIHSQDHYPHTPSKLGSSDRSAKWGSEQGTANEMLHPPEVEGMQPIRKTVSDGTSAEPAPPREEPSYRSRLASASSDTTVPSRRSTFHPYSNELASVNLDAISYQEPEDFSGSESHGTRTERSSSRSHRGRVEHSIEANLTNAEPATHVRSRKSSHYLGLFKENTASPDRKRREERERKLEELHEEHDHQDESQSDAPHARERHGSMSQPGLLAPIEDAALRTSKSLSELSLVDAPSFDPISQTEPCPEAQNDDLVKLPYRALPRSLLEEIRNFHLTPGGARGSSFSKSIPTQFSEGGRDYFTQDPAGVESSPPLETREDDQRRPSGQFEDEEEENEQISSAVYFPHERVTVSDEVDQFQSYDDGHDHVQPFGVSDAEDGHVLVSKGRGHEQESNHVDISLRSKNDSRILHGDLQDLQGPVNELHEKPLSTISERSYDSAAESDLTSADDSGLSAREEDSSLTDDAEMTPTATPTQSHRHIRPRRKHTAAPVGAVELKPYRHQVGGHTTVFRFSRRAVCKQLNNRENEFYERIERRHPEMLMFLPRYIGVLNVTFSKNPKRPKLRPDSNSEPADAEYGNESADKRSESVSNVKSETSDPQRIFSQKQVTGIIPKVILENNRHIIPLDLFSRSQRPRTADDAVASKYRFPDRGDMPNERQSQSNSLQDRPATVSSKAHNSWGATTVNRKLQEQVLREVFSPPAIHHHRRHARGHISMPKTPDHGRRRPNLSEDQTASSRRTAPESSEPPRSAAIDIAKQSDEGFRLSSSASTALDASHNRLEKVRTEESHTRANSLSRTHHLRRRHSGSGLQRRGSMNSKDRGDLMFFEDEGYGGDKEDEIFSMEGDPSMLSGATSTKNPTSPVKDNNNMTGGLADAVAARVMSKIPARFEVKDDNKFRLPSNPKEAQTRKDDRVQFFLLLEDLTAGMNKPCVLDLKMGTRQYGIEADEKKRKSQRRKCQTTTSQQLGVRLCGMQTWNVKKQEYSFEDKYFGRDLSSGREFRDALTRFLYDGVSYGSVTKKIPVILEKLLKLESMIRKLKSYRLYASSLLILYDGEQTAAEKVSNIDLQNGNKRNPLHRRVSDDGHNNMDVQLKIVDFANCVTGEDELPEDARCPPRHPDDIDRGYVRGLRTLRMYFQRILKEVGQDEYVERGEGEAMALRSRDSDYEVPADRYWDEGVMEDDPGEVSV